MLALFPLQSVVYPGEKLALHIFEERYKQLVQDCEYDKIHFGIPTYLNNKLKYGTEMKLEKIVKKYDDGKKDIICRGIRIFMVNDFYHQYPNKLYAGGDVTFINNEWISEVSQQDELLQYVNKLYKELAIENPPEFSIPLNSYQVAHKIGLSLKQEYHLLTTVYEKDRLDYLISHLKVTIPIVKEMNRAKKVIKMNGHFKNFDPLDFKELEP